MYGELRDIPAARRPSKRATQIPLGYISDCLPVYIILMPLHTSFVYKINTSYTTSITSTIPLVASCIQARTMFMLLVGVSSLIKGSGDGVEKSVSSIRWTAKT